MNLDYEVGGAGGLRHGPLLQELFDLLLQVGIVLLPGAHRFQVGLQAVVEVLHGDLLVVGDVVNAIHVRRLNTAGGLGDADAMTSCSAVHAAGSLGANMTARARAADHTERRHG